VCPAVVACIVLVGGALHKQQSTHNAVRRVRRVAAVLYTADVCVWVWVFFLAAALAGRLLRVQLLVIGFASCQLSVYMHSLTKAILDCPRLVLHGCHHLV
jgi:hypothetical protein